MKPLALLFLMGLSFALAASEPISLETMTGTLYGTLELPDISAPYPVVLIHPGSGPTDRDGNSAQLPGKNDSLKLLAEALAKEGIASVRIDKRGIGESLNATPNEADLRFDTYIDDAAAWLDLLQNGERFSEVIMLGHSEGSLIGTVAAQHAGADGFISLAGPGEPAADTLERQLSVQLPQPLLEESEEVIASLEEGQTVQPLPKGIAAVPAIGNALFRPSVQPYLISWFQYDPAEEVARLEMPVLIVQGTTDIQVRVEDAELLSAAQPAAELVILEGMNHVLKDAPATRALNLAAYANPNLPLTDGLVEAITSFITALNE